MHRTCTLNFFQNDQAVTENQYREIYVSVYGKNVLMIFCSFRNSPELCMLAPAKHWVGSGARAAELMDIKSFVALTHGQAHSLAVTGG